MFTLAAVILGGAVITTLVQAEEDPSARLAPPSYLQPALYHVSAPPSQHRWLLPVSVQGRFEHGRYSVYLQDATNELADPADQTEARMALTVGDLRTEQAAFSDAHARALMSDWERNHYRLNGALFSMSVGRSW